LKILSNNNRGFALPIVLGISLIIMIIVSGITAGIRSRLKSAWEIENRSKAFFSLRSGYSLVMYNLLTSSFEPYAIKIFKSDGSTAEWNLYGKPIRLDEDVTVSLRDTAGMIPLLYGNKDLKKLVGGLTSDSKKTARFIDAFLDWQDKDRLKRLNGAESWEYRSAGYEYEPRNSYLQVPEEIKLMIGFEPEIYEKLMNSATYIDTNYKNYLTMDKLTLEAFINSKELVDSIVELRGKKVLTPRNFSNMTGIPSSLSVMYSPSDKLMIKIKAMHEKSFATLCALVEKKETRTAPFQILEWRK